MAARWRLPEATSLADIGCGQCHWSRLLYPYLKQPARFAAVDREPLWVSQAEQLFRKSFSQTPLTLLTFVQGTAASIPLPDNSVDLIISNCVINLSPDKDQVLKEAFRVLKPGGRFAVSDIVVRGTMPQEIRHSVELWAGCVAGALEEAVYLAKLTQAGFEQTSIEPTRIYSAEDAREFLMGAGLNVETVAMEIDGKIMSGFIRAVKPTETRSCCAATCCA